MDNFPGRFRAPLPTFSTGDVSPRSGDVSDCPNFDLAVVAPCGKIGPAMGTGLTLLADDITPKARTMYVYRTNTKREPLGRHIIKTTEALDRDAIRSQFGPGWFYCMETGGFDEDGKPLPLATGAIFVEGVDPSKAESPSVEPPANPSDFFREMQELYKLRALEREARGEPSMLEMLKVVKELVSRPASEGNDVLSAFLQGAEWRNPSESSTDGDPMTNAITRLLEARSGSGDPRSARLAALLQKKVDLLQERIRSLEHDRTSLEVRLANAEAIEVPGSLPESGLEGTLVEALQHIARSGATDLTQALVEIQASAPNILTEIESLGPEHREDLLHRALDSRHPELVEPYSESLERYLDHVRTANAGTYEDRPFPAPGSHKAPPVDSTPEPSGKPARKRK